MSTKPMQTIVARRTPDVESLLQQLWSLRPELADKNKMTILLALAALLRESRQTLGLLPAATKTGVVNTTAANEGNETETIAAEAVGNQSAAEVPNASEADEWDL